MKKKSALALAMMGGLEGAMTPWAGVGVLIEAMRQTEVTSKADRVLPLKRSRKGLSSGQMVESFVLLSSLGGECIEDIERPHFLCAPFVTAAAWPPARSLLPCRTNDEREVSGRILHLSCRKRSFLASTSDAFDCRTKKGPRRKA